MHEKLESLHSLCQDSTSSFVSFRLPLETEIHSYVQCKSAVRQLQALDELNHTSGFVFSPFEVNEQNKVFVIEPDYIFIDNDLPEEWFAKIRGCTKKQFCNDTTEHENNCSTSQDLFEASVVQALDSIERGEFHKVVLSKTQMVDKPSVFSESAFFQKLCKLYPHAFVYFISVSNQCCWIGATPEPLLISTQNTMQTVSLAGTQIATGKRVESYNWSKKELDEQAVVTQFIEQALLENGIRNFRKSELHNFQAANLIHLKSVFEFPFSENKYLLSQLISALHPTPSVGGLPRCQAQQFILATESHQRSYYTGFLGVVGLNQQVQLFVNLRCMQLLPSKIILYSGAGITRGSIPEKEWIETENKIQTLKRVLFSSEI